MTVKHYEDEFISLVKKRQRRFLKAAGRIGVNQAVQNMHVLTGLLRNSIIYRIFNGTESKFGNLPGKDGVIRIPKSEDKISNPNEDYVRVGSNVVYMSRIERKFGRLAESMDEIKGSLDSLFKKVFKT